MKHLNILVEGSVQGVGFRWSVRSRAALLGVKGFVRNEDDGAVTIEAEADDAALDQFVEWCRQGPPSASVDKIEIRDGTPQGFKAFEIRF
jgi:acylphosphatase